MGCPVLLRVIRGGQIPLADAVAAVEAAETRLLHLRDHEGVPEHPNRDWADG